MINYEPMQPGDIEQTYADMIKSKDMLEFDPKTNIKEGIKLFIDWYLKYEKIKIR